MQEEKNVAVVLAAGQGKRMNSSVPKQYLLLGNRPVLFYALEAFQQSDKINEIILVTGHDQIDYCKKEIVDKYGFSKVIDVIEGGAERYLSVLCGIKAIKAADNIFVHDGARPFVTLDMIERCLESVRKWEACAVGVPVKDTIKIVDEKGFISHTPDRNYVWAIQTPQVFRYEVLAKAYQKLMEQKESNVTDDAMVVENMLGKQVKIVMGDYKNIKITTPEDLEVGCQYLSSRTLL